MLKDYLFQKGHKGYWFGKKRPPMTECQKDKIKVARKNQTSLNTGKHWKIKDTSNMRGRTGEKCSLWKGGISVLSNQIRTCFKYRQWRSDVFTRDDFTCQECNIRGCYLEAHHIKRFVDIIREYKLKTLEEALVCEELWNINNGRTLCRKCHDKTKV